MFDNDGSQMLPTLTVGSHFRHCLLRLTISSECIDFWHQQLPNNRVFLWLRIKIDLDVM